MSIVQNTFHMNNTKSLLFNIIGVTRREEYAKMNFLVERFKNFFNFRRMKKKIRKVFYLKFTFLVIPLESYKVRWDMRLYLLRSVVCKLNNIEFFFSFPSLFIYSTWLFSNRDIKLNRSICIPMSSRFAMLTRCTHR